MDQRRKFNEVGDLMQNNGIFYIEQRIIHCHVMRNPLAQVKEMYLKGSENSYYTAIRLRDYKKNK